MRARAALVLDSLLLLAALGAVVAATWAVLVGLHVASLAWSGIAYVLHRMGGN